MMLPGFCRFAQHLPHFQSHHHFLYTTGALLAVALVAVPRMGGFAYVLSLCGPFQQTLLKNQQFVLPPQNPLVFTARSYGALFCGTGTLGYMVWPRARITHSQGIPPSFYPPHMNVGLPVPLTPQLPLQCHTTCSLLQLLISTPSTCLDEYDFLKSVVVGLPYSSTFW